MPPAPLFTDLIHEFALRASFELRHDGGPSLAHVCRPPAIASRTAARISSGAQRREENASSALI